MKSVLTNQTPEQYADCVYDYRSSGFFQKIKFDAWKKRLWEVGWSMRFWTRYKALKGEDADKTFDGKLDFATREEEEAFNAQYSNKGV